MAHRRASFGAWFFAVVRGGHGHRPCTGEALPLSELERGRGQLDHEHCGRIFRDSAARWGFGGQVLTCDNANDRLYVVAGGVKSRSNTRSSLPSGCFGSPTTATLVDACRGNHCDSRDCLSPPAQWKTLARRTPCPTEAEPSTSPMTGRHGPYSGRGWDRGRPNERSQVRSRRPSRI